MAPNMTLGDLRKELEGIPDDTYVQVLYELDTFTANIRDFTISAPQRHNTTDRMIMYIVSGDIK